MKNGKVISSYFTRRKGIYPLVTFRVLFGLLMAFGGIRFWVNGWIEKLYIEPDFFFKFHGFEWVPYPGDSLIYWLVLLSILSAIGIALGLFYRVSAILFFISFSYLELIDATNYLNHYYLVCLLAFLLIFLPANRAISLDVAWLNKKRMTQVPSWCIDILIFQVAVLYFFAGVAKLNQYWLLNAMPLRVWLPEHADLPVIGALLTQKWVAYFFSYFAAFYDLTIPFWLMNKRTRPFAYFFVILFHGFTFLFFNIGLFPFIMVVNTLIFFSPEFHQKLWSFFTSLKPETNLVRKTWGPNRKVLIISLVAYAGFQILFPLRHHLYSNNVLWTEEGYRFSWRVMVVEKSGAITFTIKDAQNNKTFEIENSDYLTSYQEKQMAIQYDFILQFAHFLEKEYKTKFPESNPGIFASSFVALNGRTSKEYVRNNLDLTLIRNRNRHLPIFRHLDI